jgi:hypothetical protein
MTAQDMIRAMELSGLAYNSVQPEFPETRLTVIDDPKTGVQCYIRKKGRCLVITFRGSNSLLDWKTNLTFWQKTVPYGNITSKIRVHTGFINAYKSPKVRRAIHDMITDEIDQVRVSGHSQGAALAILCGVDLQYNFPKKDFEVIVFGAPRVGNRAFAQSYDKRVFKTLRVENGNDIVTKLPFAFMGVPPRRDKDTYRETKNLWRIFGKCSPAPGVLFQSADQSPVVMDFYRDLNDKKISINKEKGITAVHAVMPLYLLAPERFPVLLQHLDIQQKFFAGSDIKLHIDALVVGFDGIDAQMKNTGNLLGSIPLNIQIKNSPFGGRERFGILHKLPANLGGKFLRLAASVRSASSFFVFQGQEFDQVVNLGNIGFGRRIHLFRFDSVKALLNRLDIADAEIVRNGNSSSTSSVSPNESRKFHFPTTSFTSLSGSMTATFQVWSPNTASSGYNRIG